MLCLWPNRLDNTFCYYRVINILSPFQIIRRFDFFGTSTKKVKASYNLEWREYIFMHNCIVVSYSFCWPTIHRIHEQAVARHTQCSLCLHDFDVLNTTLSHCLFSFFLVVCGWTCACVCLLLVFMISGATVRVLKHVSTSKYLFFIYTYSIVSLEPLFVWMRNPCFRILGRNAAWCFVKQLLSKFPLT